MGAVWKVEGTVLGKVEAAQMIWYRAVTDTDSPTPEPPVNPYRAVLEPPAAPSVPSSELRKQLSVAMAALHTKRVDSWMAAGARIERNHGDGMVRVISAKGDILGQFRSPAEEKRLSQAQRAGERFEQRWRPKAGRLIADPKLLTKCLDEAEALPHGASRCWDGDLWLRQLSPLSRTLRPTEDGLRAALELVALWPLPPAPKGEAPLTSEEHFTTTAMWYSVLYDCPAVHAAVRGFAAYEWRTALPWSVLNPLKVLKAYDDRLLLGDGSDRGNAGYYRPPNEITYQALPILHQAYSDMLTGLRVALQAAERVFDWWQARRTTLPDGASERGPSSEEYFRVGDRLVALPLLEELAASLDRAWIPKVAAQVQTVEEIATTAPAIRGRAGRLLPVYRHMAARLAANIARNLRINDRRLDAGGPHKSGIHRREVRERTCAILRAVYGVAITPDDVKAAVIAHGKRAKDRQ